jgi:hypothetical protein
LFERGHDEVAPEMAASGDVSGSGKVMVMVRDECRRVLMLKEKRGMKCAECFVKKMKSEGK